MCGLKELWDTLWLAFHDDSSEIVDVAITERVPADIKGQHRVASRHLGEGQLFLDITQGEAVFTKVFNIHGSERQKILFHNNLLYLHFLANQSQNINTRGIVEN